MKTRGEREIAEYANVVVSEVDRILILERFSSRIPSRNGLVQKQVEHMGQIFSPSRPRDSRLREFCGLQRHVEVCTSTSSRKMKFFLSKCSILLFSVHHAPLRSNSRSLSGLRKEREFCISSAVSLILDRSACC